MIKIKFQILIDLIILTISLFCCKTEEVVLNGKINGLVTDAETSEPVKAAKIKLNLSNDTTSSGGDGK